MDSINTVVLKEFASAGMTLTDKEVTTFSLYLRELKKWNAKFNITAVKQEEMIVKRLFISSSNFSKLIDNKPGTKLLDIGTGGGFPGVPLKVILPDLDVTLLDCSGKRISFVTNLCRVLGFHQVRSIAIRAEEFGERQEELEQYTYVVAHSVATIQNLAYLAAPLLKPGGFLITRKGKTLTDELEDVLGNQRLFSHHKTVAIKGVEEQLYKLVSLKKEK